MCSKCDIRHKHSHHKKYKKHDNHKRKSCHCKKCQSSSSSCLDKAWEGFCSDKIDACGRKNNHNHRRHVSHKRVYNRYQTGGQLNNMYQNASNFQNTGRFGFQNNFGFRAGGFKGGCATCG